MSKSVKDQLKGNCRHFTGICDKGCKAGMVYDEISKRKELGQLGCAVRLPCTGDPAGLVIREQIVQPCTLYDPLSDKEIKDEDRRIKEVFERVQKGLSPCCNAPIDCSKVIQKGQYQGHGPRFCSKCKITVFMV